jgi:hypothetical protein
MNVLQRESSCSTQTERQRERQICMTKLIVGFRNFSSPASNCLGTLWAPVITVREEEPNERVEERWVDDTANSKLQCRNWNPGHSASN